MTRLGRLWPAGRRARGVEATITHTEVAAPTPGPEDGPPGGPTAMVAGAPPRLARSQLRLEDGRELGVAVAGRGIPLVAIHGFAAEGLLYAQTLSRLVGMGFKVIALDSPGHGGTGSLGPFATLDAYVDDLAGVLRALGVRRAILVGHSMGGRLVADLAVAEPRLPIGVVLVDPIVGDAWDRMNLLFRMVPPAYGMLAAALVADTLSTLPVLSDPRQAVKLARLVFPTGANHVRRPWRLVGPLTSILRATRSSDTLEQLEQLGRRGVPLVVIHGDADLAVPLRSGRSAAARAGGELVVVHGARHSWMLRDPETFPAILAELLGGPLGEAVGRARRAAGLGPQASEDEVEAAFYDPGAVIVELTPTPLRTGEPTSGEPAPRGHGRAPRFRWTRSTPTREVPGGRGDGLDAAVPDAEQRTPGHPPGVRPPLVAASRQGPGEPAVASASRPGASSSPGPPPSAASLSA